MCGVVGIIGVPEASREVFLGLTTLQHRGQDAAGILSYDAAGFHQVKDLGLVEQVFNRDNMQALQGDMAIGHARYATLGSGHRLEVQPFLLSYPYGLGLVHNGNIVNAPALSVELRQQARRHLLTQSDTEVVINLLAEGLAKHPERASRSGQVSFEELTRAVGEVMDRANGSYSIVGLVADQGMLAFRDPRGIRPLVLGRKTRSEDVGGGYAYCVASESVVLPFLGYEVVRDVRPGELLWIERTESGAAELRSAQVRAGAGHRPCMFEWVYFASPESALDGTPVYGARIALGKSLAQTVQRRMQRDGLKPDLIVPVPETSRIAAIALAEELAIPYREVLIKNRYIKRTFILDSQEKRQQAVNLKLSPVRSEIEGKRILLVDDSIVRGTTSRKIIELVRAAGAKEVYFVSTCPPIVSPCFYGIDFPERTELVASGKTEREIEQALGADAVIYQELEGLVAAVGKQPCTGCLTGDYPTDVSQAGAGFSQKRQAQRTRASRDAMPPTPALQGLGPW